MHPGSRLGPYEILRPLGAGGMGEVFLARDPRLGREVALKVLPAAFAGDPARRRRFEDEARTVAALNHPNIVTLHSIESADGVDFLTMEYVDGETLDRAIGPVGLAPARFLEIARTLAAAVAAAHRRGVVHRDLKPANVMIDREGRLKVLDFGIASQALPGEAEDDVPTRTATGMIAGTVAYMAPERLAGRPSGVEADVFSLGVLFHEMLTGRRPFGGASPAEVASSILRDPPPPLDAPAALARLVERCLEKDPRARYASAEPLAQELAQVQLGTAPAMAVAAAPIPRSIAVAAFESLAADPATDWLGVGLAETLTVELRRVAGLRVLGRDRAVAKAAESGGDPLRLGQALGTAFIVAGRFQVLGSAVRVTAELHDVAAERVTAALKLDGTLAGIFALQDRLVGEIVAALDAELSGAGLTRAAPAAHAEIAPLDAFELFARAREKVNAMSPSSLAEARGLFERAIAVSPGWALPHGGLGQLCAMRFIATTDRADLEAAEQHLRRAIELDPEYVEPLTWLAYAEGRLGRVDAAEETGCRAIARDPGEPLAHYLLGAMRLGRSQDPGDREWLRRSIAPLAAGGPPGAALRGRARYGSAMLQCGRDEEARVPLEAAAEIERTRRFELSRFVGAGPALALLALRTGDLDGAIALADRALEALAADDHVYAHVSALAALRTAAEAALRAGRPGDAAARLHRLRERAGEHPRALGAGWLVARADALASWAFRSLGLRGDEQRARERVAQGLERDNGFDFSWHWEGGVAAILVDLALAAAAAGRPEEAHGWLERAAAAGWADARRLDEDPLLEGPRALEGFEALRRAVSA